MRYLWACFLIVSSLFSSEDEGALARGSMAGLSPKERIIRESLQAIQELQEHRQDQGALDIKELEKFTLEITKDHNLVEPTIKGIAELSPKLAKIPNIAGKLKVWMQGMGDSAWFFLSDLSKNATPEIVEVLDEFMGSGMNPKLRRVVLESLVTNPLSIAGAKTDEEKNKVVQDLSVYLRENWLSEDMSPAQKAVIIGKLRYHLPSYKREGYGSDVARQEVVKLITPESTFSQKLAILEVVKDARPADFAAAQRFYRGGMSGYERAMYVNALSKYGYLGFANRPNIMDHRHKYDPLKLAETASRLIDPSFTLQERLAIIQAVKEKMAIGGKEEEYFERVIFSFRNTLTNLRMKGRAMLLDTPKASDTLKLIRVGVDMYDHDRSESEKDIYSEEHKRRMYGASKPEIDQLMSEFRVGRGAEKIPDNQKIGETLLRLNNMMFHVDTKRTLEQANKLFTDRMSAEEKVAIIEAVLMMRRRVSFDVALNFIEKEMNGFERAAVIMAVGDGDDASLGYFSSPLARVRFATRAQIKEILVDKSEWQVERTLQASTGKIDVRALPLIQKMTESLPTSIWNRILINAFIDVPYEKVEYINKNFGNILTQTNFDDLFKPPFRNALTGETFGEYLTEGNIESLLKSLSQASEADLMAAKRFIEAGRFSGEDIENKKRQFMILNAFANIGEKGMKELLQEDPENYKGNMEAVVRQITQSSITRRDFEEIIQLTRENAIPFLGASLSPVEKVKYLVLLKNISQKDFREAQRFELLEGRLSPLEKVMIVVAARNVNEDKIERLKTLGVLNIKGSSFDRYWILKSIRFVSDARDIDLASKFIRPEMSALQKAAILSSRDPKKVALQSSIENFLGAVSYAHKEGVMGKGVSVGIVEKYFMPAHPGMSFVERKGDESDGRSYGREEESVGEKGTHGIHVAGISHAIAPEANFYSYTSLYAAQEGDMSREAPQILNASYGSELGPGRAVTFRKPMKIFNSEVEEFDKMAGGKKLVIPALGNEGKSMDELVLAEGETKDEMVDASKFSHLIYAINIDRNYSYSTKASTTRPGSFKVLQENSISTLGTDVLSFSIDNFSPSAKEASGTSMAAPAVTGAAALVLEHYAKLLRKRPEDVDMKEVKEILLQSADTSFLITKSATEVEFIYDKRAKEKWLSARGLDTGMSDSAFEAEYAKAYSRTSEQTGSAGRNIRGTAKPFAPEDYGRGVLNLRSALLYAELKARGQEEDFIAERDRQENAAATKIQALFRGYKERKGLKEK